jgi:DNA-binding MarR family transcriptional regulator
VARPNAGTSEPISTVTSPDLLGFVELLFFGYRDFTAEADTVLAEYGYGRAHHRVLHFVHWVPGQRVIDLLDMLKITKQSLARVLKSLIDGGLVEQRSSASDKRERLLYSTPAGDALAERLARLQMIRIEQALAAAGVEAHGVVQRFLEALIADPERTRAMTSVRRARGSHRAPGIQGKP